MSPALQQLPKLALLAVGGFATAVGGAAFASSQQWIGGIATRGYVDAQIAAALPEVTSLQKQFVESNAEILREVRIGNVRQVERVGVVIRERVGLQAALSVGMDPKRREVAQRASVTARAKYDELVLRGMTAEEAEQRALESAGVPR